jgi:drug/metabolite transporter (DMT)-like permease
MKTWQANGLLVIVAMIWGMGFVVKDYALLYLDPLAMQIFRFGIASIVVTLVFYKRIKNASKRAIIYGSIIGVIFFAAITLQGFGLADTTVPKNAFITVTNVVWVPIASFILFKVKPKLYLFWGILIMLVGFFFLIFEINIFDLTNSLTSLQAQMNVTFGDFLTLLCAFAWAAHIIAGGRFVKDEDPLTIIIFQIYVSAILSIIFYIFMEGSPLQIEMQQVFNALPALLFMAVASSIISFTLQLTAQQYVPASNTAVICSTESLFASIFAVILGGVALTSSLIIAAIVITLGIVLAETGFKFREEDV